ncbi:hypothetical protein [Candidatus Borrarchaeum sp.]|uniref:hypothetical protein n=1 Tax=Candidatus Borrarchaeum sp. TaxID=2846742 RepID=UPI00257B95B3|nr:hypothetical protein [Candidatus Borrarchaeum sp.]
MKKIKQVNFRNIVDCIYNTIDAVGGEYKVIDFERFLEVKFPEVKAEDVMVFLKAENLVEVRRGKIRLIA